eukprot:9651821-Heterocapsa_arctica.AAC.1
MVAMAGSGHSPLSLHQEAILRVPHRTLGASKASPWRTKIKGPLLPITEFDEVSETARAMVATAGRTGQA